MATKQAWAVIGQQVNHVETAKRMKRCGVWAIARNMAKNGQPIEAALAALRYL